ncbi:MAG: single-stranded-DNA-specific exonuclease RecJ [Cytophagaceae bacterium]|nr:single-stranded-DNA-specific exonuclease RecJ [Cytophagaceae bacterium]
MEKRWVYKILPESTLTEELSKAINIKPQLASILLQRNITSFEKAKSFFRPSLNELHDPFLMKDMDKAVERLSQAVNKEEKILIYGDYDVDGTTSVSMVFDFLRKQYKHLDFYIPDRYTEGYGVSRQAIEWAKENSFKLIISLDCGIKAIDQIKLAVSYDIDFIVCDHHNVGDALPPAYAVLDPKRPDCPYPYKELSGCGVGFKLLQAYSIKNNLPLEDLYSYLDLVAISISSDIVPITGENRIMTFYGLKEINTNPRPGIRALVDIAGFKKELDVTNVVFGLGPRVNAAGRIAHAKGAVHLLLSQSDEEACHFAKLINEKNILRKDFDSNITEEALLMIEKELDKSSKSTVLYKNDWHKGVIGIVASRCIEKYYRPTIILTKSNDYATGSARSVPGFDVYEAISRCAELLEQFGGHMYAAGLTMKIDNIPAFRKKFEEVVSSAILEEQLIPLIEVDLKINLQDIDYKFYNVLKQLSPFGPQNMQPTFVSENVYDNGNGRLLKEQHLKLSLQQGNSHPIDAIGFNMAAHYERICSGEKFHVCYNVCENDFNGKKSLQLFIKDIKYDI